MLLNYDALPFKVGKMQEKDRRPEEVVDEAEAEAQLAELSEEDHAKANSLLEEKRARSDNFFE